jgi:hypothetical protein
MTKLKTTTLNPSGIGDYFLRHVNRFIEKNTQDVENRKVKLLQLQEIIDANIEFLKNNSNLHEFENNYKKLNVTNFISFKWFTEACGEDDPTYVMMNNTVKTYVYLRGKIKTINHSIGKAEGALLSLGEYAAITEMFNKAVIDEMIRHGYVFHLPFGLAYLYVKRYRSSKKQVDWGTTDIKRKEILDRGGKLYNKDTCPDGEKYLTYFEDDYIYFIQWNKNRCAIPNKSFYAFVPYKEVCEDIFRYIKANPNVVHVYREVIPSIIKNQNYGY